MDIKIIASDLDGTLLGNDSKLSKRTIEVLTKAHEMGIEIVAATGRARNALPEDVKNLPFIKYAITSNGGRVVKLPSGETCYENFILEEKALEACNILQDLDMNIEIFIDGVAYISRREYDAIMSGEITTRRKDYIRETRTPVEDIFALMRENAAKIENINIDYVDQETKARVGAVLEKIEDVTLTSSVPTNHEIEGKTTSKADALAFVLREYGLRKEQLMAFGDNPNDISMIEFAGVGIATGNAEEIVKKSADYITLPNDEDGVAAAIERFIFDKE